MEVGTALATGASPQWPKLAWCLQRVVLARPFHTSLSLAFALALSASTFALRCIGLDIVVGALSPVSSIIITICSVTRRFRWWIIRLPRIEVNRIRVRPMIPSRMMHRWRRTIWASRISVYWRHRWGLLLLFSRWSGWLRFTLIALATLFALRGRSCSLFGMLKLASITKSAGASVSELMTNFSRFVLLQSRCSSRSELVGTFG